MAEEYNESCGTCIYFYPGSNVRPKEGLCYANPPINGTRPTVRKISKPCRHYEWIGVK